MVQTPTVGHLVHGCGTTALLKALAAPDYVAEFEDEIDAAAGTKRWVFLYGDAPEELVRSGG